MSHSVHEPDPKRTPEEIRASIAETREELGDTVEALAQKTDVKGNAKARVEELKASAQAKTERVAGKVHEVTPESAAESGNALLAKLKANPAAVGIAAALFGGFVFGRLTGRRGGRV